MAIPTNKAIKISQKHLLGIQDLSVNDVNIILNEASKFIELNKSKNKKLDISIPLFIGPGCIISASSLANFILSGVKP